MGINRKDRKSIDDIISDIHPFNVLDLPMPFIEDVKLHIGTGDVIKVSKEERSLFSNVSEMLHSMDLVSSQVTHMDVSIDHDAIDEYVTTQLESILKQAYDRSNEDGS